MKPFMCILNYRNEQELVNQIHHLNHVTQIKDRLYYNFTTIKLEDTIYQVVVDGELYNRDELCNDLIQKGWELRDNSLEELVLYAFKTWGFECLSHMNGAFSFVIDDGEETNIAKDHLGLKPIYYARKKGDGLIIANNLNVILESGIIPPIVDAFGLRELFSLGPSMSENRTLFKDILSLAMGQHMVVRNNNVRIKQYYTPTPKTHTENFEETVTHVRFLVEDAIKRQIQGANASFLSGGLDSSIITAIAAKNDPKWKTYSLDYEGNKENFKGNLYQVSLDDPFIQEMVDLYHLDQKKFTITQKRLVDEVDRALIARELPGMGDVDASLLWLCNRVKEEHQDIVLSGECGDEVFGGYPWFYLDEFKDLDYFPWIRSMEERISLLNPKIKDLGYEDYMRAKFKETVDTVTFLDEDSEEDRRARINTTLCLHWFMQTLVTRQVTMGNAAELNIRAPFADVRIIDYVYNIPWDMKFFNQEEKGILRKAFEDVLPDDIAHRKKNPFPKTHNPLYTKLVKEKLLSAFQKEDSILHELFDDNKLLNLIESGGDSFQLPWYGQLMSGPQLLAYLYQIDLWARKYKVQIQL